MHWQPQAGMDKRGNKMDNIGNPPGTALLSQQVSAARYFFLNLAPARGETLALTIGGRENCNPDYAIDRDAYPFLGLEYVAEGRGVVRLDGRRHELAPGVLYCYGPKTRCEITTDPQEPMVKYFLCLAGVDAVRRMRRAGLPPGRVRRLVAHGELRSLWEDIIRDGQHAGEMSREICGALLQVLLLKVEQGVARRAAGGDPAEDTFLRCKALIDAQADKLGSLAELAAQAGVEASSLCRLFQRYQGTSPYQYLLRRKMNLAAEFLLESGGLVKEAALRVGFADPYHFSRCFKSVHGVAPSDLLRYRRAS